MQIDYSNFTEKARQAVATAHSLAVSCSFPSVEPQVMMVAMIQVNRDMVHFLLNDMGVDRNAFFLSVSDSMRTLPRAEVQEAELSSNVRDVFSNAFGLAEGLGQSVVSLEHIFWSFFTTHGPVRDIMVACGINNAALQASVRRFQEGNSRHEETERRTDPTGLRHLNKYAHNLIALAREGKIEPAIGRDDEIRRILQILSRKTKNNPMLVGAPGTGKTAIVEGLAHRILRGDVPRELADLKLFSLDLSALVAGTSQHGQFEERMKKVLQDAKSDPNIVLFVDEMHLLIGAGGSMNAANLLKPELARGELKLIGATTIDECTKYVESDKAFERRFQKILVDEPDIDSAITIMRGIKPRFEAFHRIRIQDEAILAAVRLSQRYIPDRFLPDKAIDLIDEAASKMRIDRSSVPAELDALSAQIRSKEMERESLRQDEEMHDLTQLDAEIANLRESENALNAKWQNERGRMEALQSARDELERLNTDFDVAERSGRYEDAVGLRGQMEEKSGEIDSLLEEIRTSDTLLLKSSLDEDDVRAVIEAWTGIPVSKLDEDESEKLLHLEDILRESVIGQDHAVAEVSKVIRRNRLGFGDAGRPVGSFLFMGTTGVGKTELAKTLALYLFNSREMIVRIDMSEYQQEYSVSRLFGAPPGYVGYDRGGQLTEAVRRKPYSVILLDEIEKAHPKVFETLLQVLDDGRMTDGQGRVVDFKNTIIIMTSNLGSQAISRRLAADGITADGLDEARREAVALLKERVMPEFINRIDDIVVFSPLDKDAIAKIVFAQMSLLCEKMKGNGIDMEFSDGTVDLLADDSYVPEYGARPVKRAINDNIINTLSMEILTGRLDRTRKIYIDATDGGFTFKNI